MKTVAARFSQESEAYWRGRHRVFAWMKLTPSQALPWRVTADALDNVNVSRALASAALVATLAPAVASGAPGAWGAQPSPAFTLLDLGEVTLPPIGSGIPSQAVGVRIWIHTSTQTLGIASPILEVGAVQLLPLDGPAGVLPRGLQIPSIGAPNIGVVPELELDGRTGNAVVNDVNYSVGERYPFTDAYLYFRGVTPKIGASAARLDLGGGARKVAATEPVVRSAPHWAAVSLSYRPRFSFLKGF